MGLILSPYYTQLCYDTWSQWKTVYQSLKLSPKYFDDGLKYTIYGYDSEEVHLCIIYKGDIPYTSIGYTQQQNDDDKTEFEATVKGISNIKETKTVSLKGVPQLPDGRLRLSSEKSSSSRTTLYSHNFSDPTSWYQESIYVADEVPTVEDTYYQLAHTKVIDTYHGNIPLEDYLKDSSNRSYRVTVKVDNVTKTEQDPHYGSGGDYTIDYHNGRITPLSWTLGEGSVTVTYHYAGSSKFTVKPAAGKYLIIDVTECQFSTDIVLNDSFVFAPKGYVEAFAPQYLQSNGGPYPPGTLIPLGNPFVYKSIQDFLADSLRSYVSYPAMGGNNWRSMGQPSTVFNWDYVRSTELYSSSGMQIDVSLVHDTPCGGAFSTASFYCGSVSE